MAEEAGATIPRRARTLPATLVAFVALLLGSAPGAAFAQCDSDGDGYDLDDATCLGDDCDDGDPQTHPGAPELCDGLDNDCDGLPGGDEGDGDGDGWMTCEDCDDAEPAVHPGATEQ